MNWRQKQANKNWEDTMKAVDELVRDSGIIKMRNFHPVYDVQFATRNYLKWSQLKLFGKYRLGKVGKKSSKP